MRTMINAILVDDEPLALDRLARLLEENGKVNIIGKFVHPADALEAIQRSLVDVVFLDIEMPDMNGLSLAERIVDFEGKTTIVFVTAYNEYAVEAFELSALDYLLKPVRKERLQKTLERIMSVKGITIKPSRARVQCFGQFQVLVEPNGDRKLKWRTSKAEELLAFLVHHKGKEVNRHQIMDSLWGHFDAEKGAAHFHTTVYYLRKNLHSAGIEGLIQHEKGFYKIDTSEIDCDYYEFEALAASVNPVNNGITPLENLVHMYKGRYLESNGYSWAQQTEESLEQKYVSILLQMHDYYLKEQNLSAAAEVLKKALKSNPLAEDLNVKLINVYLLANDRISAMKHYDAFARKLKVEYGIKPGDAVKQLLNRK